MLYKSQCSTTAYFNAQWSGVVALSEVLKKSTKPYQCCLAQLPVFCTASVHHQLWSCSISRTSQPYSHAVECQMILTGHTPITKLWPNETDSRKCNTLRALPLAGLTIQKLHRCLHRQYATSPVTAMVTRLINAFSSSKEH
eukprot:3873037-Amphidinium_carterae.1